MSKQAALDAASSFGVFGKSAGLTGGPLAKFSNDLVQLSGDFASFYNTSPEEALTAVQAALRGESEPIRKYGILLDDATLRQKALELGIVSSTKNALTPQQKILAANAAIYDQAGVAMGDFSRTSGGLANQQRILQAQLANVRATIGRGLLPVVTAGAKALNNFLASPAVQQGAKKLSDAMSAMGGAFQSLFSGDKRGAMLGFVGMFSNLGQMFGLTSDQGAKFGFNVMKALGPLGETVQRLYGYFKQFFDILTGSGGDMGKIGKGIGGLLTQILGDTAGARAGMLTMGLDLLQGLVTGIVTALPTLIPAALSILQGLITAISTALPVLLQAGASILMGLIQGILPQLPMLIQSAFSILSSLVNGIAQALPTLLPAVVQVMLTIVQGLITNLPMLIAAAVNLISALIQGLQAATPILVAYLPQIMQAIYNTLILALPLIISAALQIVQFLTNGIRNNITLLVAVANDMMNQAVAAINAYWPQFLELGANVVAGVWQGILAAKEWFYDNVMGFFSGLINGVKYALGIQSPSKVFANIGDMMARGLGVGFGRSFRDYPARRQTARSTGWRTST